MHERSHQQNFIDEKWEIEVRPHECETNEHSDLVPERELNVEDCEQYEDSEYEEPDEVRPNSFITEEYLREFTMTVL